MNTSPVTRKARWPGALRGGLVTVALSAVVAAGCASAGGNGGGDDVTVRVTNDRIPSTMMTVYAMPDNGIRRLLGTVRAGETASFGFNSAGGQFRFVARETGGSEVISPPITVVPPDVLDWRLQTNMVTPARSEGDESQGATSAGRETVGEEIVGEEMVSQTAG